MDSQGDLSLDSESPNPTQPEAHADVLQANAGELTQPGHHRDFLGRDKKALPPPLQLSTLLMPDEKCSAHQTDAGLWQCWFATRGL